MANMLDQPHALDWSTSRVFVNPLGELTIDGKAIPFFVDVLAFLNSQGLTEKLQEEWRAGKLGPRVQSSVDAAWQELWDVGLPTRSRERRSPVPAPDATVALFVAKVERLREARPDSARFRFYGQLSQDEKETIVVCTEFREKVANLEFWTKLQKARQATNAHYAIMDEDEEDGYRYRHVELYWPIENLTVWQARIFIEGLVVMTHEIWHTSGMAVL